MNKLRCCMLNKKTKYRGIDREANMHIFNYEKSNIAYDAALHQYEQYLGTEGKYTPENLNIVSSFSNFINRRYGNSEIILYSDCIVKDSLFTNFLGIDVIDPHFNSVINNGIPIKFRNVCTVNQYGLFNSDMEAKAIIQRMQENNSKYSDLYYVYVYSS